MVDLRRRAQVPESTFRDWRDCFITAGTAALQPNPQATIHPDWTALTQENAWLKMVVVDLSVANLVSKKDAIGAVNRRFWG